MHAHAHAHTLSHTHSHERTHARRSWRSWCARTRACCWWCRTTGGGSLGLRSLWQVGGCGGCGWLCPIVLRLTWGLFDLPPAPCACALGICWPCPILSEAFAPPSCLCVAAPTWAAGVTLSLLLPLLLLCPHLMHMCTGSYVPCAGPCGQGLWAGGPALAESTYIYDIWSYAISYGT